MLNIPQDTSSRNKVGGEGGAISLSIVSVLVCITYSIPQNSLVKLVLSVRKGRLQS